MAQTIKLRRSSTEGKVPTTAQLALGELAINTYDGRVFFEKNDGSATIQHIVTTNSVTTGSISIVGQLTVDDITINGSTISDGGDLTLDANGDIILDANGADIRLEDNSTAFGRFKRSSSDFIIKSDSNNNDIIFKGVDNSATITSLTLDMSDAGTAIFNNNIKVVGNISGSSFNGTGLISGSSQVSHDSTTGFVANEHIDHSSVSITAGTGLNGGGTIASTRTLNVDDDYKNTSLNSLTGSLVTKTGSETLTNKTLTSPDINGGTADSLTSLTVANNIDIGNFQLRAKTLRSDVSTGTAPFTVASTTTVANLSADMVDGVEAHTLLNDSLNSFTSSFSAFGLTLIDDANASTARSTLGVDAAGTDNSTNVTLDDSSHDYLSLSGQEITIGQVDISDDTNLAVSDTSEVNMILSGDTLSAELIGGVVSGSSQITNIANSQLAGSIANSKLANSSISIGGISFSLGDTDATPAFNLADATGYLTSNLSGTITNSQLAGSIANGKLANSGIGIGGAGTIDLGESVSVANILKGSGVVSGSSQISLGGFDTDDLSEGSTNKYASTTNVKSALNANLGTLTLGDSNDTISIPGNLNVAGTRTVVESTTVQLNDNILELNGGGTADGGIYVRDAEASTTTTGSLIWNTGDDKWTAGPKGSEDDVVLATATQTLTNKTINGSQLVDDSVTNAKLDNSSVSFGGVSVSLGSSDSTPAFNLADATGYLTSNLSGTITNSQLAGSIANGKLANSAITIMGTSTSLGGSFTTSDVVSALANTAVSNESLNSATGSYLTAHPNISAGSDIDQNNSNGTVLQDLTIELDSNGHVTTATAGTVNLDGRYYTESESDTLYTKKLGQGVVSGSAQIDGASITNKSVSFGGVSVNLGSSDSTPAFNLADATGYLTSNLSGTITNSQLAGSIAASKLAGSIGNGKLSNSGIGIGNAGTIDLGESATVANILKGSGVVSGSSQVSLETLTGGSGIQSGSITNADLAGSIANSKLVNDSVSFGGVSLDLGGSDATPAFNLADATGYLTSNLSGTITNSQLAGSIANAKLANSAITIDGTSVSLGGSISTDNTQLSTEQVQDIVGAMFSSNTETRISATYQDGDGTIDLVVDDMTANTQLSTEQVQDIVGAMFSGNTETRISATYQDGDGTIDLEVDTIPTNNNQLTNGAGYTTNTMSSWNISDGSTSDQVDNGETVNIIGGTNITVEASGDRELEITNGITNNNQLTNGAGYITSFDITTQTDSKYLRSNATDTASGVITFSNSTSSTTKTNGAVIVTGGVGISGALNVGGDVTAFASSDERYKDLITPIKNPNDKIKLLSGNTFVWNDKHEIYKGKKDIGVIAQEVEKVLPEIVETREDGYKAVKYEKIVALLIESNKELIKRVEELESKIK